MPPLYSRGYFVIAIPAERFKKTEASQWFGRTDSSGRPRAQLKLQRETQIPKTTMNLASLIAPVLIGSSLTLTQPAASAGTPTVDSILAKYVQAVGGKAAIEKVHSRIVQFKVESDTLGASEGEILAKAPDRQRSHIDLGTTGFLDEGFDGTVAWAKNPRQGLRVKTGDELAKVTRDARFNRELNLKSLFPDLAFKGAEKVGEEEAWVLESKPSPSSKEKFWFSSTTGLVVRQESEYQGPQGAVNVNVFPRDYKAVDGLKLPGGMKIKIVNAGQEFEFTLKFVSVKHNVEIDPAKFAKPAE